MVARFLNAVPDILHATVSVHAAKAMLNDKISDEPHELV